jgi:RHS repeat-associated protein
MQQSPQAYDTANQVCWTAPSAGDCARPPAGAATYRYNTEGDRTAQVSSAGATTTYSYDQANRLTSYISGHTTATYTYNGDGLRTAKTVNGRAEQFTWNTTQALPELLVDGSTYFIYGPGGLPVEQINRTGVLFFHHDQLGTTRLLTNTAGAVAATYTYDPYGNLTAHTGTATTPLRYAGEYQDAESGLYYLQARYYDPTTSQFLTRDPAVAATRSADAYVSGDPVNRGDPSGLDEDITVDPNNPFNLSNFSGTGCYPDCVSQSYPSVYDASLFATLLGQTVTPDGRIYDTPGYGECGGPYPPCAPISPSPLFRDATGFQANWDAYPPEYRPYGYDLTNPNDANELIGILGACGGFAGNTIVDNTSSANPRASGGASGPGILILEYGRSGVEVEWNVTDTNGPWNWPRKY